MVDLKLWTEIDSLWSELSIGFPYQFMKSWLSRTVSLPFKEALVLLVWITISKRMNTEAWRFLLEKNEIIYFYTFSSIIGYKGVTYKTEIHSCELEHFNLQSKC